MLKMEPPSLILFSFSLMPNKTDLIVVVLSMIVVDKFKHFRTISYYFFFFPCALVYRILQE